MKSGWTTLGVILGMMSILGTPSLRGDIVYVDRDATGPTHDGTTWCTAYLDLQDALDAAQSGDEILVAEGVYTPDRGSGDRDESFMMKYAVAIRGGYLGCGPFDPDLRNWEVYQTILSGDLNGDDGPGFLNRADNSYHVVMNHNRNVNNNSVLEGFFVRGGHADGTLADKTDQGSGFHNHSGITPLFSGRPRLSYCVFEDNWSANHGAVNDHGGLTLDHCEFRNNFAGMWGGGLYIHEELNTTVTDCQFINNSTSGTSGGGGGAVSEANATFINCLFSGNTSANKGGGMYIHGGSSPMLIACTFADNTALQGGAIYNIEASSPDLEQLYI